MTEKELQATVTKALQWGNWLAYHTYDSRRSEPGFPDVVALSYRPHRMLVLELKSEKGKLTDAQAAWMARFTMLSIAAGARHVRVGVLRPSHLDLVLSWIAEREWGIDYESLPIL